MFPKKVSILGEDWKIRILKLDEDEELQDRELGGYCSAYNKLIVIRDFQVEVDSKTAVKYMKEALRHEVIHAFTYGSGLWRNASGADNCAMDEQTVDWFAIQAPKIFKIYKECNAL